MTPAIRKLVLTLHVTATVGWIGAVVVFVALAAIGLTSRDPRAVRGVYLVMEPTAWWVLVPLAVASLLTGIVQSLGTRWGLFRHYWVVFKFVIAVFAVVVLLQYMETFGSLAETASSSDDLAMVRNSSPLGHAVIALLLLLVATGLSIYKPRGVTRYEQHKQHALSQPERRRRSAALLALAGIAGPVIFVVTLLGQDVLRSDYDPLAAATADPMIGAWGWVQQANFIVLGLLLIAFAVGLHRGVRVAGPGVVASVLIGVSGLGMVVAALFPLTEDASDFAAEVRDANNTVFGLSVGAGLILMSWRLIRDVRWRGVADYVALTGVAWLVMARVTGAVAESGQAPYGLMRRAMLGIWLSCVVVLAVRLRRMATGGVAETEGDATTPGAERVPAMTGGETT
jgi:hypothetical protein